MDLWDRLRIVSGSLVVDVGFGNVNELLQIRERVGSNGTVFGIEPRQHKVSAANGQLQNDTGIRCLCGSAYVLPLPDSSVDQVIFKGVLHEIRDLSRAFLEAKRVSKPNGRITIVDFTEFPRKWLRMSNLKWRLRGPWRFLLPSLDKHPGFSKNDLQWLLEASGLKLDSYVDNIAQGRFSGHQLPMYVASATTK